MKNRLERSIMPELENIPVTELKSPMVYDCLKPIENKSETVRKTLSYVNQVLNYCVARGNVTKQPLSAPYQDLPSEKLSAYAGAVIQSSRRTEAPHG